MRLDGRVGPPPAALARGEQRLERERRGPPVSLPPLSLTVSSAPPRPTQHHAMPVPHPNVAEGGKSVAVIGSGVTGLAAAWLLKQ